MHLASTNRARWLFACAALLLPACSDDDLELTENVPEEASIRAAFATWTPSMLKECSVQAAFFPGEPADANAARRDHLDAALALAKLDGELVLHGASGETVVLGAPERTGTGGFSDRELTVRDGDGGTRSMALAARLDDDGTCIVSIDDHEVYRGMLWGRLPVLAHVQPRTGELARRSGDIERYVGADVAYAEIPGLDAVAEAFTPDLPRAEGLLATTLGLSAAGAALRLSDRPVILPYVEGDGGRAPFTILGTSSMADSIPWLVDPVVPVKAGQLDSWAPTSGSVAHTLRVVLPRPALAIASYRESAARPIAFDVNINIEATPTTDTVTVTGVSPPRTLVGGTGPATQCLQSIAGTALAYTRAPEQGITVPRFPVALVPNNAPAASAPWFLVPCSVWTEDLTPALRDVSDLIGAMLDVRSYASSRAYTTMALSSRGWDAVLADLTDNAGAIDALERATTGRPLIAGVSRTIRRMLDNSAYRARPATERRDMRTLVWHAGLLCGHELTDRQRDAVFAAVESGDYLGLRDNLVQCPPF